MQITVYHASNKEMQPQDIIFPGPRNDCDFGQGFYVTESKHVAEEWVHDSDSPIINIYQYAVPEKILRLNDTDWLRVILAHRKGVIKAHYKSGVIYGLIANDRLFPSLDAFMGESPVPIGDIRLFKALSFCKLGYQYCLRTNAEGLTFIKSYALTGQEKEMATGRFRTRRQGLKEAVSRIYRQPMQNEKYYEDFIEMGDYHEI